MRMNTLEITIAAFALLLTVGCDHAPAAQSADGASEAGGGALAYHVHQADGVTLATFDDWESAASSNEQGTTLRTHPRGRRDEFSMTVYMAPMADRDRATFLETGPADFARAIPGVTPRGEPRPATFGGDRGGDDARLVEYDVTEEAAAAMTPGASGARVARAAFLRKNDVGVVVFAVGTEAGVRELGRAVEIVGGSVAFTESPLDPALVGRWYNAGSMSSGMGSHLVSVTWEKTTTFRPDGTFSETDTTIGSADPGSVSGEHGKHGRVIRRGQNLTFHYDDGSVRTSDYALQGDTLKMHGKQWTRQ